MSRREDIFAKIPEVPRMPAAVQQAVSMLNDPDADLGQLADIISVDPGITANLLRLANSSLFRGTKEITTVREAVVRLGAAKVCQMVISLGVAPQVKKPAAGYDLPKGQLLLNSIAVAASSEQIASSLQMRPPEHTFASGLLSNIGKTILSEFLEVDAGPILEMAQQDNIPFEEAERRVLGTDHCEVGAALLQEWELPSAIVQVVRYKLEPDLCPQKDTALDLVHAGDILAKMSGLGLGLDGLLYQPSQKVVERLQLTTAVMEASMAAVLDQVSELSDILGVTN